MSERCFGLIMAGGQGTRFWPWSTPETPKQFLPVTGRESLLRQTYERLAGFLAGSDIFVIAAPLYRRAIAETLPELPAANIILEPGPRNTAPALMLANVVLSRLDPDATLLVVPADHHIEPAEVFQRQMRLAMDMADDSAILTVGIPPGSPHTGYGYIQFEAGQDSRQAELELFQVKAFKEKPDLETAGAYLRAGNYFWNSGMFIYRLSLFSRLLAECSPYYHTEYRKLEKAADQEDLSAVFQAIKPDSIDYALLEKTRAIKVCKSLFSWDDLGSWTSVYNYLRHDPQGNAGRGRVYLHDCRSSMAFSTLEIPLLVVGAGEIAVIATENGILVAPMDRVQEVKDALNRMPDAQPAEEKN